MVLKWVSVCSAIAACVPVALALDCSNPSALVTQLELAFSNTSAIGCSQSELQLENAKGYWGIQYAKNASIVAYPSTTEDVADAVQAYLDNAEARKLGFAFGGGLHGSTYSIPACQYLMWRPSGPKGGITILPYSVICSIRLTPSALVTGAAATDGYLIDLRYLNKTEIIKDAIIDEQRETVITYEGGARWGSVLAKTNGSGYTAVGARDSTVGVGGFSTGGGIGFLAGVYGFSGDRLVAMDVILMNGSTVHATKKNQYADLFWAIQGGGGQFGIVSKFYQKAAPVS